MTRYSSQPDFAHDTIANAGILLTNLGTPDAPTAPALRRYLGEFLSDPRIVEMPRWVWKLILHGVILRIRPPRAARAYRKVWTPEGSPLLAISRQQRDAFEKLLKLRNPAPLRVALGMRYGTPSIASALEELRNANVRRILILPLYPQYSATTTASTFDAIADVLRTWRWLPELRMVTHYHDQPDYISAVANSITRYWQEHGEPDRLLFSFHGLPRRYLLAGDPYHCQCHKSARLIAERLGVPDEMWQLAFQSRFGREEWLKPYTDHTLKDWAKQGTKNVHVVCPGFAADCLETLEEIDMQNREVFLSAGGERFGYIPALNDHASHVEMMATLAAEHGHGWLEFGSDWNAEQLTTEAQRRRERALDMGAER